MTARKSCPRCGSSVATDAWECATCGVDLGDLAPTDRVPAGTYEEGACEVCGRRDGLHDHEECFK